VGHVSFRTADWRGAAARVVIQVGVSMKSSLGDLDGITRDDSAVKNGVALLIRHAHTDAIGSWLAGRMEKVSLSAAGRAQAERLGRGLATRWRLGAVYTSPLERAGDTATAIARHQQLSAQICQELSEIDFGAWTGRSFAELEHDTEWRRFNRERSRALIPGGERVQDVQFRMVRAIADLAGRHPAATIALVSHADPLRCALLHYQAMSLDRYHELQLAPASITAIRLTATGARILSINDDTIATTG
jgi:broad specificity phosphatase PhoE